MQQTGAVDSRGRDADRGARLFDLVVMLAHILVRWQAAARERAQLAALSDDALKDVGLTRCDILAELRKPRWRR